MNGTTNTFQGGLVKDMHPLTQTQQTLSDAMNATLITFNGNEQMLQNDMGNTKIQDSKTGNIMGLRDGFIPVGLHEHGGIMYIASVDNEGNGQIGTIPSPVIKYAKKNTEPIEQIYLEFGDKESSAVTISDKLLYPEDKFLIYFDDRSEGIGTIFKEYNVPINVSGSVGIKYISYPYISKPFPTQDSEQSLEYKKGLYKLNLYAKTKNNTIKLNNSINDLTVQYKDTIPNNYQNHLWFAYGSPDNVNEEKMIQQDGSNGINYFLHYPSIAPGSLAISTEPETIDSFSLAENLTNAKEDGIGQIYPITIENQANTASQYYIGIQGFIYETHSAVHVDKISIFIDQDKEQSFEIGKNLYRGKISETKFIIGAKATVEDYLNKKELFLRQKYVGSLMNKYIYSKFIGETLNRDLILKVKYYCTDISEETPLGTYTLNFNQYYFDTATPYLQEVYWEAHTYSNGKQVLNMAKYPKEPLSKQYTILPDSDKVEGSLQIMGTGKTQMAIGKALDDSDTWANTSSQNVKLSIPVSLDTKAANIATNYQPSTYLNIPLNIQDLTEGEIQIEDISCAISIITSLHNYGSYWDKCKDPQIKFDLELSINDNSSTTTKYTIKGRKEAYNGQGRIYLNVKNSEAIKDNVVLTEIQKLVDNKNSSAYITLKLTNIQTYQVSYAFPDKIWGDLDSDLSATVTIKYSKSNPKVEFVYPNKSDLLCSPQYDLFGKVSDGFKSKIVPVNINKKDSQFKVANVSNINLLNLDNIARVSDSSDMDTAIVFDGLLNDLYVSSLKVIIPQKKRYLLAATKEFKIDPKGDPNTDFIIDGNTTNSIIVYSVEGESVPNIGLYELLDQETDNIIKQSCVVYYEGGDKGKIKNYILDRWKKRVLNLSAKPEYIEDKKSKGYNYLVNISGGNMEEYRNSNGEVTMKVPVKDKTTEVVFIEKKENYDYEHIVLPGIDLDNTEIGGIKPGEDIIV